MSSTSAYDLDRVPFSKIGQKIIDSPQPTPRQTKQADYILHGQVIGNKEDQLKQLSEFRNNLQNYGKAYKNENGLQVQSVDDYYKKREEYLNQSSLNDVSSLRSEYVKRGGQNPEFLQNLQNIEKYFDGKRNYSKYINNPNALQIQRNHSLLSNSYSLPMVNQSNMIDQFSNDLQNFSMLTNQNQLTIPPQYRASLRNPSQVAGTKSEKEQVYDYLNVQESECLLDMSRMHPNSYMYQNKKEQYQKIRQLKNEIEKSMIFSKVNQNIGNMPRFSQSAVMPSSIPSKLVDYSAQNDYFPQRNGVYFPDEGFIIRFDYAALLPPTFDQVFINFGIFKKGQSLDPFLKTAVYNSEPDTVLSQKCIFTEKRNIHEVKPHQDTILYFELFANERDPLKRTLTKRAWTMHEVFDSQNVLNCGRFKLPFYTKNLNPQLLIQTGLQSMADSNLFIRICFPNDPYLDNNTYVFIENEYKTPYFHMRNYQQASPQKMNSLFSPQVQIIRDEFSSIKQAQEQAEKIRLLQMQQDFDSSYVPNDQLFEKPSHNNYNSYQNEQEQEQVNPQYQQQQQVPQNRQQPQQNQNLPIQQQQQQQKSPNQTQLSVNTNLKKNSNQDPQQKQSQQIDSQSSVQVNQNMVQPQQPEQSDQIIEDQPQNMQTSQSFYNQPYIQQNDTDAPSVLNSSNPHQNPQQNDNNLTDGVVIKIVSLEGFKIDELKGQINIKIFEGENTMLDFGKQECNELYNVTYVSGFNQLDLERVFQIGIKNMLKSYKKIQLDKIYLYISILSGNQSLAWLATPLFKTSYKSSSLNNGKFKENLNKPPAKKPPFLRINPKSDMIIEYIIHDPDLLENEVNEFDTIEKDQRQQPKNLPLASNSPVNNNDMTNGLKIAQVQKIDKVDGPRNVLIIQMDNIQNYTNDQSISYDLVILKPQEIVNDEFGNPAVYHFDELIPCTENTDQVDFDTTINVPLDVELTMKNKQPNWEQYHIIIKFVEVDDNDIEVTLGWYAHPIFKNKKVNQGSFSVNIYDTPLQVNVPLNNSLIKKRLEKLNFRISYKKIPAQEYNLLQVNEHQDQTLAASSKQATQQKCIFTVVIHHLKNLEKDVDLQINIALFFKDDFMQDDLKNNCTFQGDIKKCTKKMIQFLEEYNFELDIRKLAETYRNYLSDINLVFYLLDKSKSPKYWFYCRLFDDQGNPRLGTFEDNVYNIPVQRMTQIDTKKLKQSKATLKFSFMEGTQDEELESQYSPD
ncbi:hypothetical protein ABPG74_004603 [Tetrahymena malaccensis]